METKQFAAESKRLLDLMINSIYTHKEIFLRELLSNANDALNKLHFYSLTNSSISIGDLSIKITIDKDNRLIKIIDNGVGMSKKDLEENLGTIAKSGTFAFKNANKDKKDLDIIGKFGVGFYSAFMVASKVEVLTRAYNEEKAYKWESFGADGYTIEDCDKENVGTEIILTIKPNDEDEKYDEYLNDYKIKMLIKKYSDYTKYPIIMGEETINSQVPIWKLAKKQIKKTDYDNFYKNKFYDYKNPLRVLHTKAEGMISYISLLFVPESAPMNFYSKEYEKGLQLYSNGVLIMERCDSLLPDYFGFVKGIVDSEDISLNISREMLQKDKQLSFIAGNIEKKIKNELLEMLDKDRKNYEKMYKNFGLSFKYGIYENYGAKKDLLKDLLLFKSSFNGKYTTLKEYVSRMKEEQKVIYYGIGNTADKIKKSPQAEGVLSQGFEILFLNENIDEFAIKMLLSYDGKEFKSIASNDLDFSSKEEKDEIEELENKHKSMFEHMQTVLDKKVSKVQLSKKLKSHAVCLTSEGELSIEMERVLKNMPNANDMVAAKRILELNPKHGVFTRLIELFDSDAQKFDKYTQLLYGQSLLIEGIMVEDAVEFSNLICELM